VIGPVTLPDRFPGECNGTRFDQLARGDGTMKKILIAALGLGLAAGPVAAATMPYPEKAESQVRVSGHVNTGIVEPEVPLKEEAEMLTDEDKIFVGSDQALAFNSDVDSSFILKTPNR
jgi:hypothetical protein